MKRKVRALWTSFSLWKFFYGTMNSARCGKNKPQNPLTISLRYWRYCISSHKYDWYWFWYWSCNEHHIPLCQSHIWVVLRASAVKSLFLVIADAFRSYKYFHHDWIQGMDRTLSLLASILGKCTTDASPCRRHTVSTPRLPQNCLKRKNQTPPHLQRPLTSCLNWTICFSPYTEL
jgi:hypothetical protein